MGHDIPLNETGPLDWVAVTRASQAISRELDLEDLLGHTMQIMIQSANAQKGALVLAKDSDLVVEAEGEGEKLLSVLQSKPVHESSFLSPTIVNHVFKTGMQVILDDAAEDTRFAQGPYVQSHHLHSVLCLPIVLQRKVIGVLYLENNASRHAFTSDRVQTLEFLAAQAAISLQNARAHRALEVEVEIRRQTEEALRESETLLRQTVEELTRSNDELERFAYVASHDLQEPLRKIRVFGDRLKMKYVDVLNEQGLDYLERMQNAARRMQQMIDDLLAFSRVTTHRQPFASVDLNQVVQEALLNLEVRLEQTAGRVEVAKLPTVEADAGQIRQLFQNLIGNGLKFHQVDVPPVVKISASMIEKWERDFCQIFVQDNGIGFEEKYLERLFQPFQRLHGRSKYEGTGIGLAICHKIVERHGGQITAQSAPGEGATFIVTLPVWR